jgi:hypothetical protein
MTMKRLTPNDHDTGAALSDLAATLSHLTGLSIEPWHIVFGGGVALLAVVTRKLTEWL